MTMFADDVHEVLSSRSHLDRLEAEAITIIREVVAGCESPVLLFSGGKDSAVLLWLALKAFRPARVPFPVMHVDTGHNFPEVIEYRDALVLEHGLDLVVASVQKSIDDGRIADPGPTGSRNRQQAVTLLDAIKEHKFDAAFGGARRDEEKARRLILQSIIDNLVLLKKREHIRRKLSLGQANRRGGKERDRRSGWSRLVSIG